MGLGSRTKGARGELEAAEALGRIGLDCSRTAQRTGKTGLPDLECDGVSLHIEVKRTERLNPYAFMDQAVSDSTRTKRAPLVVMRSSHKPWLILCRLDDLPRVVEEYARARSVQPATDDTQREAL
jgi:Holliday junction resolvase